MLLAAATETKLIADLCEALPTESTTTRPPLAGSSAALRRRLLLTLLFLGAFGLQRTWDLRGYTAAGLALLTGRLMREADSMQVELRPFNDRQLNRDLAEVCARVNQLQPALPYGRRLVLSVSGPTLLDPHTRRHDPLR